jgi:hypothetical protein
MPVDAMIAFTDRLLCAGGPVVAIRRRCSAGA